MHADHYATIAVWNKQAQRARGLLATEVRHVIESQKVDAFIGNSTDWERVCVGNLVGMPVIVIPTGFKKINGTRRCTTVQTGIYAAPYQDGTVCTSLQNRTWLVFLYSLFSS